MSRRVRAVSLCEDLQHDVFFRRMLKLLGYRQREIHVVPYPDGEGCGEQHVRKQFPIEVTVTRQKTHHRAGCLVTVIDADRSSVTFRQHQLRESLTGDGQHDRLSVENIALFIPKRNIETWITYLLEVGVVDEDDTYPKLTGHESDCYPAVDRFIALARSSPQPAECPPSLQQGLVELQRIPR